MHCDVAPEFNLKIEHLLHLNRMEREKVTLSRYIIRFRIQWKWSDSLVFNDICEPIIRENVASPGGVEKNKNNLMFIEKKKRIKTEPIFKD